MSSQDMVDWLRDILTTARKNVEEIEGPLILTKLGAEDDGAGAPWIPDEAELDSFRNDLNLALEKDFRLLVLPEIVDNRNLVLADIDAKLTILNAMTGDGWGQQIRFPGWDAPTCSDNCGTDVWWSVVRTIAYAYSNQPGYQEEWKP